MSCTAKLELYDYAKKQLEEMRRRQIRPQLLVTGRDLIAAGYKPGPRFKAMLEAAEDAQLGGRGHDEGRGAGAGEGDVSSAFGGLVLLPHPPPPSRHRRPVCNCFCII